MLSLDPVQHMEPRLVLAATGASCRLLQQLPRWLVLGCCCCASADLHCLGAAVQQGPWRQLLAEGLLFTLQCWWLLVMLWGQLKRQRTCNPGNPCSCVAVSAARHSTRRH